MFGILWHHKHILDLSSWQDRQDRLISEAHVTKSQPLVPKVSTDSSRLTLGAALPSLTINTNNDKNNSTNNYYYSTSNMERPAKSVPTKWSKQTLTLTCRRANATARFFAQFRRNKNRKKLLRELGDISRRTNVDNDGGIIGNSRHSTSGKVVLVKGNLSLLCA